MTSTPVYQASHRAHQMVRGRRNNAIDQCDPVTSARPLTGTLRTNTLKLATWRILRGGASSPHQQAMKIG